MKKLKRMVPFILTASMILSMAAGCAKKPEKQIQTTSDGSSKIVNEPVELSMWAAMNANVSATASTFADTELYKELEKRTGVHIKFQHPPTGQETESLNVLLASGDLPDMIEYQWLFFPGGPETAIQDDYIIKLNDLMDKSAPNLKKYLNANPDKDKMVKTDSGSYYVFPFIRESPLQQVFWGPVIRKDWLDDLGLPVPSTIDEWYTTLKAFKDRKGAKAPFTDDKVYSIGSSFGDFSGAYGVKRDFYQVDGKVTYGPMEPAYKDFLTTMNKWYNEGLLDPDFASNDQKTVDAKITSGQSGAVCTFNGGGLGKYLKAMKEKDAKFNLVGTVYPTLKQGEVARFGQYDYPYTGYSSVAITTKCKQPEIAARWLDYAYGDEGHKLFNFGIEGESYTMVDANNPALQKLDAESKFYKLNGSPLYTDAIYKNSSGWKPEQVLARYTRVQNNGPFVAEYSGLAQDIIKLPIMEQQPEAITRWKNTEASKYNMPPVTPSTEESKELATIMNEIKTYSDEMFVKFVMGAQPLSDFDQYVEQLKKMNIKRAIEIEQAALERYNKR